MNAEVLKMQNDIPRTKITIANDRRQERINQEILEKRGISGNLLEIDDYRSMELNSKNKMKSQPCASFLLDEKTKGLGNKCVTLVNKNHAVLLKTIRKRKMVRITLSALPRSWIILLIQHWHVAKFAIQLKAPL